MSSGNIPNDDTLCNGVTLSMSSAAGGGSENIYFQFPLMIKSDSKGGRWNEVSPVLPEPIAIFMGGQPREISLAWTYIVTGQTQGGNVWDITKIANQVKTVRSYFYSQAGTNLIIKFRAYNHVGPGWDYWTFRSDNVDISHSGPLITDSGGSVFHMRTDIGMKLKFLTTLKQGTSGINGQPGADQPKIVFPGLKALPSDLSWF